MLSVVHCLGSDLCGPNAFTIANYDLHLRPSKAARMPRKKGAKNTFVQLGQAIQEIPSYGGKNKDNLARNN